MNMQNQWVVLMDTMRSYFGKVSVVKASLAFAAKPAQLEVGLEPPRFLLPMIIVASVLKQLAIALAFTYVFPSAC